jgi:hypothetical protein
MSKGSHYEFGGLPQANEDELEKIELLKDIQEAKKQLATGKIIKHQMLRKQILKHLNLFCK